MWSKWTTATIAKTDIALIWQEEELIIDALSVCAITDPSILKVKVKSRTMVLEILKLKTSLLPVILPFQTEQWQEQENSGFFQP